MEKIILRARNIPKELLQYFEPVKTSKSDVFTINTQPYPEAHFAVFPEELPRLCILAGSKPHDIVFDPFTGSGTTLAVARRLGRKYLGIELNAEYIKLAEKRIKKEKNMFEGI